MRIEQLSYFGSKQYEIIISALLIFFSMILVYIVFMLIQNESDKAARILFLQNAALNVRAPL